MIQHAATNHLICGTAMSQDHLPRPLIQRQRYSVIMCLQHHRTKAPWEDTMVYGIRSRRIRVVAQEN